MACSVTTLGSYAARVKDRNVRDGSIFRPGLAGPLRIFKLLKFRGSWIALLKELRLSSDESAQFDADLGFLEIVHDDAHFRWNRTLSGRVQARLPQSSRA